uniref:Wsv311-like protein n=1 Tax=Trachysalambria curvirostris nimavirus TaxID=2984282 RepID=A0A9C7C971_9VIRU|nr:MAG: wsv311-like protein [Trachysalambria curvirostris nimavirus]
MNVSALTGFDVTILVVLVIIITVLITIVSSVIRLRKQILENTASNSTVRCKVISSRGSGGSRVAAMAIEKKYMTSLGQVQTLNKAGDADVKMQNCDIIVNGVAPRLIYTAPHAISGTLMILNNKNENLLIDRLAVAPALTPNSSTLGSNSAASVFFNRTRLPSGQITMVDFGYFVVPSAVEGDTHDLDITFAYDTTE